MKTSKKMNECENSGSILPAGTVYHTKFSCIACKNSFSGAATSLVPGRKAVPFHSKSLPENLVCAGCGKKQRTACSSASCWNRERIIKLANDKNVANGVGNWESLTAAKRCNIKIIPNPKAKAKAKEKKYKGKVTVHKMK